MIPLPLSYIFTPGDDHVIDRKTKMSLRVKSVLVGAYVEIVCELFAKNFKPGEASVDMEIERTVFDESGEYILSCMFSYRARRTCTIINDMQKYIDVNVEVFEC